MDKDKILESLSPIERSVFPHISEDIDKIVSKSKLDKTTVLRALTFLQNKGLLSLEQKKERIIELGTNGVYYKKHSLPERKLLSIVSENKPLSFQEASSLSKLSENEFKVALGTLKKKVLIEIKNGKLFLKASKQEMANKMPEELFLETLPRSLESLKLEEKEIYESLKSRKDILELKEEPTYKIVLTTLGHELKKSELKTDLIEELTPEIIKNYTAGKKFRRYDIQAPVPQILAGKRHFVNDSIEKGKKIWLEMGFKEMSGDYVVTSFWNFDALFTAQDHPVREMHDTFFIKGASGELPSHLIEKVKEAHEKGVDKSTGWDYKWDNSIARKVLIRTHTTSISAKKLATLSEKDLPVKFFSIGKCFRNETLDWSHGFEFNQSEGIVVDKNANFRQLIAYLKEFAEKMGYKKFRIQPAYFPYTEPSLEGAVWNEEKQKWVEVLAAGIFRPEVTIPLLGTSIPVLAWGPGFDRLMMAANGIKDLRELHENDLKKLRSKRLVL